MASINTAPETVAMAMAKKSTNNSVGYTTRRRKIIDDFINGLWAETPKYNKFLKAEMYEKEKTLENVNQEPDEREEPEEPTKEEKRFKAAKKDHELTRILWTNAALSDSHLDFTKYDDGKASRQDIEKIFKIEKIDPDVQLFSGDTYLIKMNNYNRIVTRKTFSKITSAYRGVDWHGLLCQEPVKIGLYNSEEIKSELSDEFVTNIPFIACVDITIDDLKTSMIKFFDYLTYENDNSSTSCYCYEHPETNELYNNHLSFYYSEIQMEWAAHPLIFSLIASMIFIVLVLDLIDQSLSNGIKSFLNSDPLSKMTLLGQG